MSQFTVTIQNRIKSSSASISLTVLKIYSGMMLGLVFALIGEEIFGYGSLSFSFVMVTVLALFWRLSRKWGWVQLLSFDLICILVGLLLRMYIYLAPGA